MAITKILNIMESEGRNPATHLKNALEYIQNPDKTEECILVGGINCQIRLLGDHGPWGYGLTRGGEQKLLPEGPGGRHRGMGRLRHKLAVHIMGRSFYPGLPLRGHQGIHLGLVHKPVAKDAHCSHQGCRTFQQSLYHTVCSSHFDIVVFLAPLQGPGTFHITKIPRDRKGFPWKIQMHLEFCFRVSAAGAACLPAGHLPGDPCQNPGCFG